MQYRTRPTVSAIEGMICLLLGTIAVIWLITPIWGHQNLNDDSFITLTYAKNLLAGRGFVYNHPPATLGTTSPFFVFVVAGIAAISPMTVVQTAIFVSGLAWVATGWVVYALLQHQGWRAFESGIVALVVMSVGYAWLPLVGMEIWLFEFLLVLSVLLVLLQRYFWAGIIVGLLFLTRGEGVLLAPILGTFIWWVRKKIPTSFFAGGLLVAIPWVAYAWITFGTILPNTLAAKRVQSALPTGRLFIERIVTDLLPQYFGQFAINHLWFLNAYLLLIGFGIIIAIVKKIPVLLLLLVWVSTYLVGYTILNPQPYYWYMLHIIFVAEVLAGAGIVMIIRMVAERQGGVRWGAMILAGVVVVLAMMSPAKLLLRDARTFSGDARADSYRTMAAWLVENTTPDDSVAFIEIGYLGYFTNNRIIDLAGLVDPITTPHILSGGFSWAYWHYHPDYYVFAKEFNWALSDIEPDLKQHYTPVMEIKRDTFDVPLVIYKRNES